MKLNNNTKIFLKLIDKRFKYIAKDKNGLIGLYISKPKKTEDKVWFGKDWFLFTNNIETVFGIDLSFISWEDEEPTLIEDLLGDD